ncbi:hypothetical protein Tco_1031367 [Tanacetum coccineum]|uniref:Uncharacterized protein n=1 Tax=Tanacetum coccineum TaxID=301880 RepID=A0ABQ5G954_9ASTR
MEQHLDKASDAKMFCVDTGLRGDCQRGYRGMIFDPPSEMFWRVLLKFLDVGLDDDIRMLTMKHYVMVAILSNVVDKDVWWNNLETEPDLSCQGVKDERLGSWKLIEPTKDLLEQDHLLCKFKCLNDDSIKHDLDLEALDSKHIGEDLIISSIEYRVKIGLWTTLIELEHFTESVVKGNLPKFSGAFQTAWSCNKLVIRQSAFWFQIMLLLSRQLLTVAALDPLIQWNRFTTCRGDLQGYLSVELSGLHFVFLCVVDEVLVYH